MNIVSFITEPRVIDHVLRPVLRRACVLPALPAGLARLPRRFAVILVRESAPVASAPISAKCPRTARPSPLGLRARFVHLQGPPADFLSVERSGSLGRLVILGHFHEGKAPGLAGFAVHRNVDTRGAKVIPAKSIVAAEWVRMKCQFESWRGRSRLMKSGCCA